MNVAAKRVVIAVSLAGAIVIVLLFASQSARPVATSAPVTDAPVPAVASSADRRIESTRRRRDEPQVATPVDSVAETIDGTVDETELVPDPPSTPPTLDDRVIAGLRWFKAHQSKAGSWHDPAATGVALLAFFSRGETPQSGRYRETVKNGLKYLREVQDVDGCLVPRESAHMLRDHAVAGLALTEAYGVTQSPLLKEPSQRAVAFALKSRMPSGLGWGSQGQVDVEATCWMSMMLKSAKMSELESDDAALHEAVSAIDALTDRATGRVRAPLGALSDEAVTAIGILVRVYAGHAPDDDEMIRKGAAVVAAKPPVWGPDHPVDRAAWYFGTLAIWQAMGDGHWPPWCKALCAAVAESQSTGDSGDARGSWDPPGVSPSERDRVWATAFSLLSVAPVTSNWYPRVLKRR